MRQAIIYHAGYRTENPPENPDRLMDRLLPAHVPEACRPTLSVCTNTNTGRHQRPPPPTPPQPPTTTTINGHQRDLYN